MTHAGAAGLLADGADRVIKLGLATLMLIIALIGGRILPAFTRNWLVNTGRGGPLPVEPGWFDAAVLLSTVVTLVLWLCWPTSPVTGAVAGAVGVAHLARLARWQGWRSRSEEQTSELQSLMRISYAVFCLKKKKTPGREKAI